jgi:hypothetical protein
MTPLIAIFSVLDLLGCLHMQLARNPIGAKTSPDLFTCFRVGAHHAQPRTLETVGTRANPAESATLAIPGIAECTSSYQNR